MGTLLDLDIAYVRKGGTQKISIGVVIIKKILIFSKFPRHWSIFLLPSLASG